MARPRIVIVGAGFAGYRTARTLAREARGRADITVLNPTDYFLYLPLLPQVAAGLLEPRRVTVSLSGTLREVRLVLGEADRIDLDGRTVHYTDPEGGTGTLPYDRLVLAAGSVNKLLPIPGVAEHAHGFRGLPEALYLRDHITRQIELAAGADNAEDCAARCTFVVVGAGYTGTEVAAHGQQFTEALVRSHPLRNGIRPRWLLLDVAERVLPELDAQLSRTADRVLRRRGVEVRMGTSVKEATGDGVLLTDGEFVDTRTLVWCVGVRPDPLAESLGLPLERGRLLVEPTLRVPGRPEVFACGDAAAVPDLEKPGQYTPMTAQHAWRQGTVAGRNVAASLSGGELRPYRHKDMGFVVDLGGAQAAANPLGVHLPGLPAGLVTRGYHLAALPGNRVRVAADWLLDAVLPRQSVQLGLVRSWSVPLDTASPELARVPGGHERRPVSGPGAALARDTRGPAGSGDDGSSPLVAPTPADATDGQESGSGSGTGSGAGEEDAPIVTPTPDVARDDPESGSGDDDSSPLVAPTPADATDGQESRSGSGSGPGDEDAPIVTPTPDVAKEDPESGSGDEDGPLVAPTPDVAKDGPGSDPAEDGSSPLVAPTPDAARNQPGGEPAKSRPGGEAAKNQPGGEAAKNQPGGEPAKNQPGGEPAGSRPAPGPVQRTHTRSEGDQ
ncbi:FAD-dependent oxidoreductase [Streptomyces sp. NPDC001381]|uniref:FAD-dependent oxidoreductase n=1 Tax=Streptomyces sp. NPDC001381 TaxID=3364567 RepID=UPI0036967FF3